MRFRLLLLSLLFVRASAAQTEGLLQLDDRVHTFLERQWTRGLLPGAHLLHRPLSAYEAGVYLDSLDRREAGLDGREARLSHTDAAMLQRLRGASSPPNARVLQKLTARLYQNNRNLASVAGEDFQIVADPLFYGSFGRAWQRWRPERPTTVSFWQNTRGMRVAGHIGRYLFFESRLEETQQRDVRPQPARWTAPRIPFTRLNSDSTVYDYQVMTGVVGFRSKHFEIRAGRDRNQWSPGASSLILSDFAPVYDHVQIRTSIWRLQYVNLFAAFTDVPPFHDLPPNTEFPRKYGAFHSLSLNASSRLSFNVFEAVIFAPDSVRRTSEGFDLSYLNPVVMYRSVEADRGSPDNVFLGAGISWIATPGLRLYGQLLLDELLVGKIGTKSWQNKWGWLAGFQTTVLPQLTTTLEFARLRPFLYSHFTASTAFLHYNDPLGHPAGPNAFDVLLGLQYQPVVRWQAALNASYTVRGRNSDVVNYGSDPRVPYPERPSDSSPILQGIREREFAVEASADFEVFPNLYAGLRVYAIAIEDGQDGPDSFIAPGIVLRWGLPRWSVRY